MKACKGGSGKKDFDQKSACPHHDADKKSACPRHDADKKAHGHGKAAPKQDGACHGGGKGHSCKCG